MHVQAIEYHDQDTVLEGFYANDEPVGVKGSKPIILVAHDWSGCNDFAREKAKKLAELGYIGFAIDMFGKGKLGTTKEEKTALMQPLVKDRARLRQRIQAAFTAAKTIPQADSSKIAVMGFCFGGLCALDLARSGADIRGAVSFHGLLNAPEGLKNAEIKAKILVLHGYDDPMAPPEQVNAFAREMTQAPADWQIHMYGHTMHGFTNPQAHDLSSGIVYEAHAEKRSWQALKDFLNEIF